MTVIKYDWGVVSGGSSGGGGGTTPTSSDYGEPETFTGTLAALSTVTFSRETKSITIINTDDSNGFEVSFDNGATWIAFGSYGDRTFNVSVASIQLQPLAGSPTYSIVAVLV